MIFTGWPYADPLFAALIAVFILPRAWTPGRQALRVLTKALPKGVAPVENKGLDPGR